MVNLCSHCDTFQRIRQCTEVGQGGDFLGFTCVKSTSKGDIEFHTT